MTKRAVMKIVIIGGATRSSRKRFSRGKTSRSQRESQGLAPDSILSGVLLLEFCCLLGAYPSSENNGNECGER